ncbi:MAG TPA: glycerol-3-phosphate responsive antiterminator [Terriglobales bacterium]|jgi:glycerol uptake operon antiterminator
MSTLISTESGKIETAVAEQGNHHGNRSREQRARESMQRFSLLLDRTRIIPAVRSTEFLELSSMAPGKIVYFLFGNPENTAEMMERIAGAGKVPIVNIDLAAGLSRDQAAVSYLAHRQVQGIISTHPEPLRAARDLGLFAIKRTFLLDSAAVESAVRSLEQFMPDALEVLPGMAAPHIIRRLQEMYPALPVIAGGLITTLREIETLVDLGIHAVSVSDHRLWVA